MNEINKQKTATGLGRICNAFLYTFSGLAHAFKNEKAFQQETAAFFILFMVIIYLPFTPVLKLILILCNIAVLIVELLNSAIESVADKASPEYSDYAKNAKDMGSAAVFLAILASITAWIFSLLSLPVFSGLL